MTESFIIIFGVFAIIVGVIAYSTLMYSIGFVSRKNLKLEIILQNSIFKLEDDKDELLRFLEKIANKETPWSMCELKNLIKKHRESEHVLPEEKTHI